MTTSEPDSKYQSHIDNDDDDDELFCSTDDQSTSSTYSSRSSTEEDSVVVERQRGTTKKKTNRSRSSDSKRSKRRHSRRHSASNKRRRSKHRKRVGARKSVSLVEMKPIQQTQYVDSKGTRTSSDEVSSSTKPQAALPNSLGLSSNNGVLLHSDHATLDCDDRPPSSSSSSTTTTNHQTYRVNHVPGSSSSPSLRDSGQSGVATSSAAANVSTLPPVPSTSPPQRHGRSRSYGSKSASERNASDIVKFIKRFPELSEDRPIHEAVCAFVKRGAFLVQGVMYVCSYYICFFSPIAQTKLKIPIDAVVSMKKKRSAFVVPNAIEIKTKEKRFFFASFLHRDKMFTYITEQVNQIRQQLPPSLPIGPNRRTTNSNRSGESSDDVGPPTLTSYQSSSSCDDVNVSSSSIGGSGDRLPKNGVFEDDALFSELVEGDLSSLTDDPQPPYMISEDKFCPHFDPLSRFFRLLKEGSENVTLVESVQLTLPISVQEFWVCLLSKKSQRVYMELDGNDKQYNNTIISRWKLSEPDHCCLNRTIAYSTTVNGQPDIGEASGQSKDVLVSVQQTQHVVFQTSDTLIVDNLETYTGDVRYAASFAVRHRWQVSNLPDTRACQVIVKALLHFRHSPGYLPKEEIQAFVNSHVQSRFNTFFNKAEKVAKRVSSRPPGSILLFPTKKVQQQADASLISSASSSSLSSNSSLSSSLSASNATLAGLQKNMFSTHVKQFTYVLLILATIVSVVLIMKLSTLNSQVTLVEQNTILMEKHAHMVQTMIAEREQEQRQIIESFQSLTKAIHQLVNNAE